MQDQNIQIGRLSKNDGHSIATIAAWYREEWNTPLEKTISRLSSYPNPDTLIQAVVSLAGQPLATAGIRNAVNIHGSYPELKTLGPWLALVYTHKNYRSLGFGTKLLAYIEQQSIEQGIGKIYLYTYTAETFLQTQWLDGD